MKGDAPLVAIGTITAPHGVTGAVRVYPHTDFTERFAAGLKVFVEQPPGSEQGRWTKLQSADPHKGLIIAAFDEVNSRNQAEGLRGAVLRVRQSDRFPLPAGTFYVDDLIGLPVYRAGGGRLGILADVELGPGNDVYVVEQGGRRARVPAVRQFVKVDLAAGRVTVDPIPGMLDDLEAPTPNDGSLTGEDR